MRTFGLGFSILMLSLALGCGPKAVHIDGKVTYLGKPIEVGTIEFVPVEGTAGPSTGGSIKAGQYAFSTVQGLASGGRYQVRIFALAKSGKTAPNVFQPGGPPMELAENYIPATYNSNSTLTVTLSPDSAKNTFDFQLAGK